MLFQKQLQLMNNEELPDYKQNFLREMEELRQQQLREQQPEGNSILAPPPVRNVPEIENNIINTSQYSSATWKQHLNQTSYRGHHNDSHYELNLLVNPEVGKKKHNIQLTPISEYSNAMHNKTVFVNPKNISC